MPQRVTAGMGGGVVVVQLELQRLHPSRIKGKEKTTSSLNPPEPHPRFWGKLLGISVEHFFSWSMLLINEQ